MNQPTVTEEISSWTLANGTGNNTSNILNYTNGTAQVQTFTPASLSLDTTEIVTDYASSNIAGALDGYVFYFSDGNKLTLDAGTSGTASYTNASSIVHVPLIGPNSMALGTLTFDTSNNSAYVTLPNGFVVTLPNISGNVEVTAPTSTTPLQVLNSYLSELGYSGTALNTAYYNFRHPTGTQYDVTGSVSPNANNTAATVTYTPTTPGAQMTGENTATYTSVGVTYTVPATNYVQSNGADLTNDTINNIDNLIVGGSVTLTNNQFSGFSSITGSGTIVAADNTGSLNLTASSIAPTASFNLTASGWGGSQLTGNNAAGETLTASLFGNDTLTAGNGTGDTLVAGEGVDTLTGGTGGDTFVAMSGLANGSNVTGGLVTSPAINTLKADGDISAASVTRIQTLLTDGTTLNANEFSQFATIGSISGGSPTLTLATGGTYNLSGVNVTAPISINAASSQNTTVTGNDTAGGTQPAADFTASGNGNDTLTAGGANGDSLSATGNGNDALSTGDGGSDTLSATGTGTNTLQAGNGNSDTLTASNGTDTLTAGNGNNDTLTVTTAGNSLTAGSGTGDVLNAAGGSNVLQGGSGGDIFNVSGESNTVTGGAGNDTINLIGSATGQPATLIDLSGSTINGGGGTNTLSLANGDDSLDMSNGTISNIQNVTNMTGLTLTASELSGVSTLQYSNIGTNALTAATAGTYDVSARDTTDTIQMNDLSIGGGVTLIDNNANNDTLNSTQAGDTLNSGNGNSDIVTASGNSATITVGNGTGDTVNDYGIGGTITTGTGSGDIINAADIGQTVTVGGNNATVYSNLGNIVALNGSNDIAYIAGLQTGGQVSLFDPAVTFSGGVEQLVFGGTDTVKVQAGKTATIVGLDGTVTVNNDASGGLEQNITNWTAGGSEVQNLTLQSNGTVQEVDTESSGSNGSGNYVYTQTINTTSSGVVSGAIYGHGDVVPYSNASLTLGSNDAATFNGSNDTVAVSDGATATFGALANNDNAWCENNTIVTFNGNNETFVAYGTGNTLTLNGINSVFQDDSSTDVTNSASGNNFVVNSNGDRVTINTSDLATVNGTNNTIIAYKNNSTINVQSGTGNFAEDNASGTTITLNGTSNEAQLNNSGTLTMGGSSNFAYCGSSDTATVGGTSDSFTIYGDNNTITLTGGSDTLTDANTSGANSVTLSGSSETAGINDTASDTLTLSGSNDTVNVNQAVTGTATATLSGSGDVLKFAGATSDAIVFSGTSIDELILGSAASFAGTVAGMGSNDSIDLANFAFSGTPTVSSVTGTGATGTYTDVTITDGSAHVMLALLCQTTSQYPSNASAYTLKADGTGSGAGTLFEIAPGH